MKKKEKILFTGGNSNIGSDLSKKLVNKYSIVSTYNRSKTKFKNKNFKQLKYNFRKKLILNKNFDHLIHAAAITPVNSKINKNMYNLNLNGINQILNSQNKLKSIILLSTISVYGKVKKSITLGSKKKNLNFYGKSKLKMENIIKAYSKKYKTKYLILRMPGVIGNFRSESIFMNKVFEKLYKNQKLVFYDKDTYTNNIVHTDTLSKIITLFLSKKKIQNKIINLCSKKGMKLGDIVNLIHKKLNSKSQLISLKKNLSFSISPKSATFNKLPIIDTKKTILKTIKYYIKLKNTK